MNDFIYFFSLVDSNIRNVLIGTVLLGFSAGIIGTLVVLNKRTLIIDAISHSMLPGICIGFLISGVKNPVYLLIGGVISATISVWLINQIKAKSKIKIDGAIAISLSFLFSLGVITLNFVQNSGNPNQSGLNDFLFGKAASMVESDLYYFGGLSLISIICIPIFYRIFKISLFDSIFAESIGINKFWTQALISFLTIITAAAGLQTVGIILMSAMIIAPSAAALFWTKSFGKTIILSGTIGITSAVIGVYISYLSPEMPTGPWIVICLSSAAIISVLFSPRGLIVKQFLLAKNQKNIVLENLLKNIYKLHKKTKSHRVKIGTLLSLNNVTNNKINNQLKLLKRKGYALQSGDSITLTEKGIIEAERVIRIHRLWELYLQKYMHLPSQFVHDTAESIEHIITPELERLLEKTMGKPELDPHQQKIPYRK